MGLVSLGEEDDRLGVDGDAGKRQCDEFLQVDIVREEVEKVHGVSEAHLDHKFIAQVRRQAIDDVLLLRRFHLDLDLPYQLKEVVYAVTDGLGDVLKEQEVVEGLDVFLVENTFLGFAVEDGNEDFPDVAGQDHKEQH